MQEYLNKLGFQTHIKLDKFAVDVFTRAVLAGWSEDQRADGASIVVISVYNGGHIVSLNTSQAPDA